MRRKLIAILCIFILLITLTGVMVSCVQELPPPDDQDKPSDQDPPVEPPELEEVTMYFEPVADDRPLCTDMSCTNREHRHNYNGEKGVGADTYFATLKAKVSVSKGTARALLSIKSLKIKKIGEEVAIVATTDELAKMSIESNLVSNITTTEKIITIRVKYGDFSDPIYYGATFDIELEANPTLVE